MTSAEPSDGTRDRKGYAFADLGDAVDRNVGVRCDGMHFLSSYDRAVPNAYNDAKDSRDKTDPGHCPHSGGALDATIVKAAREACTLG